MSNLWGFLLRSVFCFATLYLCCHAPPGCSSCAVTKKMPYKWPKGAVNESWGVAVPVSGLE